MLCCGFAAVLGAVAIRLWRQMPVLLRSALVLSAALLVAAPVVAHDVRTNSPTVSHRLGLLSLLVGSLCSHQTSEPR